jgi:hypothetical protein
MAPRNEITRSDLRRALAVNALTKPLNIGVTAAVVVAAILVPTIWLAVVAALVYAVLATMTFFDSGEAERVGDRVYGRGKLPGGRGRRAIDPGRLAAPIATQLSAALEAETRIRRAISGSQLPFTELGEEVTGLIVELDRTAGRAQLVYDYLAGQNPRAVQERLDQLGPAGSDPQVARTIQALRDQQAAQQQMESELDRYYAEMEQTVAALGTIEAQVVQMSVASSDTGEEQLAGRVRDLRDQVNTLTEGMSEAYAQKEAP